MQDITGRDIPRPIADALEAYAKLPLEPDAVAFFAVARRDELEREQARRDNRGAERLLTKALHDFAAMDVEEAAEAAEHIAERFDPWPLGVEFARDLSDGLEQARNLIARTAKIAEAEGLHVTAPYLVEDRENDGLDLMADIENAEGHMWHLHNFHDLADKRPVPLTSIEDEETGWFEHPADRDELDASIRAMAVH